MMSLDEEIVKLLSKGLDQRTTSFELKRMGVYPNSLSTIEKRLSILRKEYRADTNFHLACKLVKRGVI